MIRLIGFVVLLCYCLAPMIQCRRTADGICATFGKILRIDLSFTVQLDEALEESHAASTTKSAQDIQTGAKHSWKTKDSTMDSLFRKSSTDHIWEWQRQPYLTSGIGYNNALEQYPSSKILGKQ